MDGINLESFLLPISWKKPRMIFVNSMSDLFHKDVSNDFIFRVFETMNIADWHIFQVLTKRPENLLELDEYLNWSDNIWMGVSVENKDYLTSSSNSGVVLIKRKMEELWMAGHGKKHLQ